MLGVGCRLKVSASFTCRRFRRLSPRSRSANSSCAQLIRSIFSSKNQQLTAESSRCVQSDGSNVVRSKSLSTSGSWTFSYSPGGAGSLDTTTVTNAAGTTTYKHIGPMYAGPGNVWKVGLLAEKRIGNTQIE